MNIDSLYQLTKQANDIEEKLIKLNTLSENEYLAFDIKISNFYDITKFDNFDTDEDMFMLEKLKEYYQFKLEELMKEIKTVANN